MPGWHAPVSHAPGYSTSLSLKDASYGQLSKVSVPAAQALELRQEDTAVQEELVVLLERDPSPDVRRALLGRIASTDGTLPG